VKVGDSPCHLLSRWYLSRVIFSPSLWRRYVPPKRRLAFNGLHSFISQKIVLLITTAVRVNRSLSYLFCFVFSVVSASPSSSRIASYFLEDCPLKSMGKLKHRYTIQLCYRLRYSRGSHFVCCLNIYDVFRRKRKVQPASRCMYVCPLRNIISLSERWAMAH
jgi:hypothetical protein